MTELPFIPTQRKVGTESFHRAGLPLKQNLLDFWQWGSSDILKNTERAILAEYLVAVDLGVTSVVRAGWLPFDLTTPDGVTVEVKASSYIQTWFQRDYSKIAFDIEPKRAWDPLTDTFEREARRQALMYVFCLLHHRDQATIDPLDVSQWTFYVLPTAVLNEHAGDRKSTNLTQLLKWGAREVPFGEIRSAIGMLYPRSE